MKLDAEPVRVAGGFAFCEGPAFGPDGRLAVVNLKGSYISQVGMDGRVTRWAETPGPNGGQFDTGGRYLVCEVREKAIMAVDARGEVTRLVDGCDGGRFNGPNDLVVDADGGYYFTDPEGSSLENRIGAVYYVSAEGRVRKVDDGLAYPNGVNITADRSALIVAETLTQQLHRYRRRDDGSLGPRELFCQLSGGVGPDGMAFDVEGNLFVAHFGTGTIDVVDPDGALRGQLKTPGADPTNCCFGPPGSAWETHLFVTETETDTVWRYDVGVAGMELLPSGDGV